MKTIHDWVSEIRIAMEDYKLPFYSTEVYIDENNLYQIHQANGDKIATCQEDDSEFFEKLPSDLERSINIISNLIMS